MKIRKRFFCLVISLFLTVSLCGCSAQPIQDGTAGKDTPSMFVVVEETMTWRVVYHKDTKVMYAVSCGGYNAGNFTLLETPDGSPMLWVGDGQ